MTPHKSSGTSDQYLIHKPLSISSTASAAVWESRPTQNLILSKASISSVSSAAHLAQVTFNICLTINRNYKCLQLKYKHEPYVRQHIAEP